jgi:hypothetical protein
LEKKSKRKKGYRYGKEEGRKNSRMEDVIRSNEE